MIAAPLLAVDGGNSKTDVALLQPDGSLLAAVRGPGSNPHALGLGAALDVVERIVDAAWADAGLAPALGGQGNVASVGAFFIAGADQPEEEQALADAIARRGWAEERLVANDTLALLWAGSSTGWGVAVIVGAGINCVGRARSGATARFPALGWVTGEWGGGHDLGLAALGAGVRAEDGRGPTTLLTEAVARYFGKRTCLDVALAVHQGSISARRLVELPRLLFAAAVAGDGEAIAIVDRQADEVVRFAGAALRRLDLTQTDVEVVLGGAVLTSAPPRLLDRVREQISAIAPAASVVVCRVRPLVGAALAALHVAGADGDAQSRLREVLREDRIRTMASDDGGGPMP
jgi:N-acetylglucosamine kinase-like BadF-type ATPase